MVISKKEYSLEDAFKIAESEGVMYVLEDFLNESPGMTKDEIGNDFIYHYGYQDKIELYSLISKMDIRDVMSVINNDERVLLLDWFYPEHLSNIWGVDQEKVNRKMWLIKNMFSKLVESGSINIGGDIEQQKEYLSDWDINIE